VAFVLLAVRMNEERKSSVLVAGAFALVRLLSLPLSGGYANPARSLGHCAAASFAPLCRNFLWIYTSAPFVGGLLATFSFWALREH
jgi:glycerol uptake facilitator-like aquaporin